MDRSLYHCVVSFFISCNILYFKVIFCLIWIVTLPFFCFPFAWNIFFHPLIFSLYVSLGLNWISYRQHIYGSCFSIHSASLCLLVGAFNPFTFKVIIDIYVPIAIFIIVWGWFCRSFFFLKTNIKRTYLFRKYKRRKRFTKTNPKQLRKWQ